MRKLWKNHRKICVAVCAIMTLLMLCAYLFTAFRVGVWHKEMTATIHSAKLGE